MCDSRDVLLIMLILHTVSRRSSRESVSWFIFTNSFVSWPTSLKYTPNIPYMGVSGYRWFNNFFQWGFSMQIPRVSKHKHFGLSHTQIYCTFLSSVSKWFLKISDKRLAKRLKEQKTGITINPPIKLFCQLMLLQCATKDFIRLRSFIRHQF